MFDIIQILIQSLFGSNSNNLFQNIQTQNGEDFEKILVDVLKDILKQNQSNSQLEEVLKKIVNQNQNNGKILIDPDDLKKLISYLQDKNLSFIGGAEDQEWDENKKENKRESKGNSEILLANLSYAVVNQANQTNVNQANQTNLEFPDLQNAEENFLPDSNSNRNTSDMVQKLEKSFDQNPQNVENISQRKENLSQIGNVSQRKENLSQIGNVSQRKEDLSQIANVSQREENLSQIADLSQRKENLSQIGNVSQRKENLSQIGNVSQRKEDLSQIANVSQREENLSQIADLSQRKENLSQIGNVSQRKENLSQIGNVSQRKEDLSQIEDVLQTKLADSTSDKVIESTASENIEIHPEKKHEKRRLENLIDDIFKNQTSETVKKSDLQSPDNLSYFRHTKSEHFVRPYLKFENHIGEVSSDVEVSNSQSQISQKIDEIKRVILEAVRLNEGTFQKRAYVEANIFGSKVILDVSVDPLRNVSISISTQDQALKAEVSKHQDDLKKFLQDNNLNLQDLNIGGRFDESMGRENFVGYNRNLNFYGGNFVEPKYEEKISHGILFANVKGKINLVV
jgi:uncharacterized protein YfkK (UPF0435 family)